MRVLVTGGSGYLGAAIVRCLVRHGHEPIVFARHATQSALRAVIVVDGNAELEKLVGMGLTGKTEPRRYEADATRLTCPYAGERGR